MAKKPKTLEVKLRSAIRLIWSRSAERRAHIAEAATLKDPELGGKGFVCPLCHKEWPIQFAEVDHEPPIGPLSNWRDVEGFIDRMFYGPQRAVCKICHKRKTASQRKKGA